MTLLEYNAYIVQWSSIMIIWYATIVQFLLFKVREAYKTYMKRIAKLLGGGPGSDEKMMKVFEFETQLAMVSEQLTSMHAFRFNSISKRYIWTEICIC